MPMDAPQPNGAASNGCPLCAMTGALAAAVAVAALVKVMVFSTPAAALPLDETCSLSAGACTVSLPDGGTLRFSLGPRPVPLLKPLGLQLRVEGSGARATEVDFSGITVPMAFSRAHLSAHGGGRFGGEATLPLCGAGRMVWQATVLLEDGQRKIYAPFRFETGRENS